MNKKYLFLITILITFFKINIINCCNFWDILLTCCCCKEKSNNNLEKLFSTNDDAKLYLSHNLQKRKINNFSIATNRSDSPQSITSNESL
jgi:hypothetical protein